MAHEDVPAAVHHEAPLKRCSQCRHWKSHEAFGRNARRRDGLQSWCRPCDAESSRRYHEANREAVLERNRRYREANHEAELERKRLYREANREAELERNRRYHAANPERALERNRRRRAREREAVVEPFTVDDLATRLEDCDYRCVYCDLPLDAGVTWDHVRPLHHGGAHAIANLVPACSRCNSSKGPRAVRGWIPRHLERLDSERLVGSETGTPVCVTVEAHEGLALVRTQEGTPLEDAGATYVPHR